MLGERRKTSAVEEEGEEEGGDREGEGEREKEGEGERKGDHEPVLDHPCTCISSTGIPKNNTAVPCSLIRVKKEISYNGCSKNVSMNYCSGSCGTFAM